MIQSDPANPMSSPPAGRAQPGLVLLMYYLITTWGGMNLGIYVDRPKRGGTTASLHRDGRALDWRHESLAVREMVCDFLIANADLLQIQAIHFYELSKIWTPDRGWHHAKGESFGESYAKWIHVERNLVGSADTRPISEILYVPKPTPELPKAIEMLVKLETGVYYTTDGSTYVAGGLAPQSLAPKFIAAGVSVIEMTAKDMKANFARVEPEKR